MMGEIPHKIFSLKCSFGIGYGIGRKYLPILVSVSVSDLNQNNGFGRTLKCMHPHFHPALLLHLATFVYVIANEQIRFENIYFSQNQNPLKINLGASLVK